MFRTIWHVAYVAAVVASAFAAFGVYGLFPAALVIAFWSFVYLGHASSNRIRRLGRALIALVAVIVILAMLLPGIQNAREASRVKSCRHQLLLAWLCLDHYRKLHGDFPAASTTDADGNPLLSWRVALLPYAERNDVYRRIDQAKPWNDPANVATTASPMSFYICPSDICSSDPSEIPATNYFAVVDPRTIWRRSQNDPPKVMTDDPSKTVMLIEAYGREIAWASPVDLTFDDAVQLLTGVPNIDEGHHGRRHVLFANGSVGFISTPLTRETAEALLTCQGGESVPSGAVEIVAPIQPYRINQWALLVFLLLSVLPITRLGARPDPSEQVRTEMPR
jgi:type II secretory pathway pseudopilin PulG